MVFKDFIFVEDVCEILLKLYKKSNKSELKINTNKFLRIVDLKNV